MLWMSESPIKGRKCTQRGGKREVLPSSCPKPRPRLRSSTETGVRRSHRPTPDSPTWYREVGGRGDGRSLGVLRRLKFQNFGPTSTNPWSYLRGSGTLVMSMTKGVEVFNLGWEGRVMDRFRFGKSSRFVRRKFLYFVFVG